MKALSIRQPWAWAIVYAGKRIENRTWKINRRGSFLIHASKSGTRAEHDAFVGWYKEEIQGGGLQGMILDEYPDVPAFKDLPRGGIIGQASLYDCIDASGFDLLNDYERPWFTGPYGFVLDEVKALPFRPLRGKLGFFRVDERLYL